LKTCKHNLIKYTSFFQFNSKFRFFSFK